MEYKQMDNQGAYNVMAKLERDIDAAKLRQVTDAARYPSAGIPTKPKPEPEGSWDDAIRDGFDAVCGVLRYGFETLRRIIDITNPLLDPGLIVDGRIHYPVSDEIIQCEDANPCEFCSLKEFCADLEDATGGDDCICDKLKGEDGYHFVMLDGGAEDGRN